MDDFLFYTKLGLYHILDPKAYDHLLFLVALTLPYLYKQLRQLVVLVTVFMIGHTISLWAASAGIVRISATWIEFLIPITILLTALHVLYWNKTISAKSSAPFTLLALFFGVIHGLGFSNYFSMVFADKGIGLPLLYFTLGIEAAQTLIVVVVVFMNILLSHLGVSKRDRLLVGSSIIIGILVPILISSSSAL
ncbi:MAG: HupE/UreJ family protein [Bacteroidetes bacterium]|nr:HupE/UreJ family protein [Bacteroidota bacterium]MDA0889033.1 HupE/UreJ family protein [Bacteroidota bacterium]MDA1084826.1 HupE/UreJ family protein [Bacteroidota bacterium]